MWQIIGNSLWDALIDTLKIILILYFAYLLIGYLTHHKAKGYANLFNKSKKIGPLVGAFLGSVPQCGFSSVMADVYSKRAISLGTLIAVFIATSDEAIPILIGHVDFYADLLVMIALKIGFAIVFGYLVDLSLMLFDKIKKRKNVSLQTDEKITEIIENVEDEQNPCDCECHHHGEDAEKETEHHHEEEHHGHKHAHGHCCADNIFLDALYHTLNISLFIFIVTALINILIECVGLDFITSWLGDSAILQILLCCLIGFIPNCAGSVLLVELYINGGIIFSAMLAGLSVGSGIGLFVLFSKNRGKKGVLENISIMGLLYAFGVIAGLIVNLFY